MSSRHDRLRGASKKMSVPTGVRELRNAAEHCFRSCWRLGINAQQEVYIFNMRFKQQNGKNLSSAVHDFYIYSCIVIRQRLPVGMCSQT